MRQNAANAVGRIRGGQRIVLVLKEEEEEAVVVRSMLPMAAGDAWPMVESMVDGKMVCRRW